MTPPRQIYQKPIVFIAAHKDEWGLENANKLFWAAKKNGLDPVLVVSETPIDPVTKKVRTKVKTLEPARHLKETITAKFMDWVDSLHLPVVDKTREHDERLYTFKELAKFSADGKVHYVNTGLEKCTVYKNGQEQKEEGGGLQIQKLKERFEAEGRLVLGILSGDVIAFLTPDIVNNMGCFSTHPGKLTTRGMQASSRERILGKKPQLHGSVFRMGKGLDQPENLRHLVPVDYDPSMPLFETRALVFDKTTDKMVEVMPQLIEEMWAIKRKQPYNVTPPPHEEGESIADLTDGPLMLWLDQNPNNATITREGFLKHLTRFLPKGRNAKEMELALLTEINDALDERYESSTQRAKRVAIHENYTKGNGSQEGLGIS